MSYHKQIKGHKLTLFHAIITMLIVVVDIFSYWEQEQPYLLYANIGLLTLLLTSLIWLLIDQAPWRQWLSINFCGVVLNLSFSAVERAFEPLNTAPYILLNAMYAIGIIMISGIMLNRIFTYAFAVFFSGSFILAASLSNNTFIQGNIITVVFMLTVSAFATDRYIAIYQRKNKKINALEEEAEELRKILAQETSKARSALSKINKSTKVSNVNLSKEVSELENILHSGLSATISDYLENSESEEALFIKKLTKTYPELSPNELKISLQIKMGLNTKEIAEKNSSAPNSVKVFRSRIRKKMNLPTSTNLAEHLNSI